MNESIIIVDNAFDLQFCNKVLENSTDQVGSIGGEDGAGAVDKSIRRSSVKFLNGTFQYPDIIMAVHPFIRQVNDAHFQFDLFNLETLQFTEYDSSTAGEYKPHKDSDDVGPDGMTRKLSIVIQITSPDNYEGGELIFPESNDYSPEITKKQGTAIVFPSYLLHGVTPVTSGNRKSLVGWVRGPSFK